MIKVYLFHPISWLVGLAENQVKVKIQKFKPNQREARECVVEQVEVVEELLYIRL